MARYIAIILLISGLFGGPAVAQHGSLFAKNPAALLIQPRVVAASTRGSLFQKTSVHGFMTPLPDRTVEEWAKPHAQLSPRVAKLLDLIAAAEAGPAGYNAVQYGAVIRPGRPPTQKTFGEIFDWIANTPGQPHAIGRYQFIPKTLRRLVAIAGYSRNTRFTPKVQDQLALILLQDAGLTAFQAGTLPQRAFMKNLARIWAGLPLPNGKSYYQGYAGNKATMSFARFEEGMAQIF